MSSHIERRRRVAAVATAAVLTLGVSLWNGYKHGAFSGRPPAVQTAQPASGAAADSLKTLAVKGRAPMTGYVRSQFGDGWETVGGCDMREHILARDMTQVQLKSASDCTVMSGTLNDPYTGKVILFKRGAVTNGAVQIDHVVALGDAWQKGAQTLPATTRQALANDPLELLAVDGPTNQAKGDGDAATWLPPNKDYRCRYIARQIAVKAKYQLWVTQAEHDAMQRVLQTCPGQQLPGVASSASQ